MCVYIYTYPTFVRFAPSTKSLSKKNARDFQLQVEELNAGSPELAAHVPSQPAYEEARVQWVVDVHLYIYRNIHIYFTCLGVVYYYQLCMYYMYILHITYTIEGCIFFNN